MRCGVLEYRNAFWNVVDPTRKIASDPSLRNRLFVGVYSELIGIGREIALPNGERRVVWFSADATPACFGGGNWDSNEPLTADHQEFLGALLPGHRKTGFISDAEFLVDVMCAVVWIQDAPHLGIFGLARNGFSNMRITKGEANGGVALNLTRRFHMWMLHRNFRFYSFYIRSGRKIPLTC